MTFTFHFRLVDQNQEVEFRVTYSPYFKSSQARGNRNLTSETRSQEQVKCLQNIKKSLSES